MILYSKILSMFVAVAVLFSSTGLSVSFAKSSNSGELFGSVKQELKEGGAVIGEEVKNVYRHVNVVADGTKVVTFTEEIEKSFTDKNKVKEKHRKINTIKLQKDGKVFINNKECKREMLKKSIKKMGNAVTPEERYDGETGGVYALTYYRETAPNVWTLQSYPDASAFLEVGVGSARYKYNVPGSYHVSDFKRYAQEVDRYQGDFEDAYAELLITLGVALVTWEYVVILAVEAGAAGWFAYQMVSANEDCTTSMDYAYKVLGRL